MSSSSESSVAKTEDSPFNRLGIVIPGAPLQLDYQTYYRVDVLSGNVLVPALVWKNPKYSDRVVIALNGAVSRADDKDPREVFQRRTWVNRIRSNIIFLADPTLSQNNRLAIGWGQGEDGSYAIPAMAQTAQYLSSILGVGGGSRLYYGSSAGGFQAIQLAVRDRGSSALVNNAQFDWTLYMKSAVKRICEFSYGGLTEEDISKKYPGRVSPFAAAKEYGHLPRIRYLVNAASASDVSVQLPTALDGYTDVVAKTPESSFTIELYSDSAAGHNPISQAKTIAAIHDSLDGLRRQ